ncbi:hypothetical protein Sjap_011571 [Stephania japonica]|uniref:non-specific serine/threonine protein kinase n=1 Tax=Stephania japonica TaxID=461633 RepID=A0AAP0JBM4_9MAGN
MLTWALKSSREEKDRPFALEESRGVDKFMRKFTPINDLTLTHEGESMQRSNFHFCYIDDYLLSSKLQDLEVCKDLVSGSNLTLSQQVEWLSAFRKLQDLERLFALHNLTWVIVRDNEFSGEIPSLYAWNLTRLEIVSLTLYIMRDYRKKKREQDLSTRKLTLFQSLHLTEGHILSNLNDSNMIGSGGSGKVYKVHMNSSGGKFVVVKKIWNKGKSDLDRWLHGKRRRSSAAGFLRLNSVRDNLFLDWPTRLQIVVGASQGLCYMHHDCSPPIIHIDVKSCIILLDSKFKAKIADFGLAC